MLDIKALAQKTFPYAVELRRYFHKHPEATSKEFNTIKSICTELTKLGIPYAVIPDGGILATIEGEAPAMAKDPHVLLRADCDALTMNENTQNTAKARCCISENPGVAHMCGHDSHMAMLLGAAKILSGLDKKNIKGRIYLLFERGEEGGNCIYYVKKYIEKEHIRIDSCFAMHVEPDIPTGKFIVEEGYSHAGNVNFEIGLTGKGGHGSRPDLANNPLDCFIAIMNALKDVRGKYISPLDLITYNIGCVQCGQKRNIVPENLLFKGTARFLNPEAGKIFKEKLNAILQANAKLYDCTLDYQVFTGPSLSVKNNKDAAKIAQQAIAEMFGPACLVSGKQNLGSESFATLAAFYPSIMVKLGVRNEAKGATGALHSPVFDLDEDALSYGMAAHVAYALKFLDLHPNIEFTPFNGDADAVLKFTNRPVPKRYDQ